MKMKICWLMLSVLVVLVGLVQAGDMIEDRESLDALLGSAGTTQDFESLNPGSGTFKALGTTLTLGDLILLATVNVDAVGPDYFGGPTSTTVTGFTDFQDSEFSLDFTSSVTAFGLDMTSFPGYGYFNTTVTIYGLDDTTVLDTFNGLSIPEAPNSTFFGYGNSLGIGQILFQSDSADGFLPLIDDLTYGVPEPCTLMLCSMGAGLVGWLRRRRAH
jgi:hypothetical protein